MFVLPWHWLARLMLWVPGLPREEVDPYPRPGDQHSHPSGPGAHDAREYLAERRDPRPPPDRDQLKQYARQPDNQVAEHRDRVRASRSPREPPTINPLPDAPD